LFVTHFLVKNISATQLSESELVFLVCEDFWSAFNMTALLLMMLMFCQSF
jgi:hypothetical protein